MNVNDDLAVYREQFSDQHEYPGEMLAQYGLELVAKVEELRAVLAPVLLHLGLRCAGPYCCFCGADVGGERVGKRFRDANGIRTWLFRDDTGHKPDCPVLRSAELLGLDASKGSP